MRVLFISGSIGLGHAGRDLAIARALRTLDPEVDIRWLAGDPARQFLSDAGETLLPEADELDDTIFAERTAGDFSANVMSYARAVLPAWKRAVQAYVRAARRWPHDLLVGDETYELVFAQEKHPDLVRTPFVVIYDFLGFDAMGWSPLERLTVRKANVAMSRRGRAPRQDLVLFVGEPEDVAARSFGIGLPDRRGYACQHYEFVGYVLPFDPADYRSPSRGRAELGYDNRRRLVVCAVGGSAIGVNLLRLCAATHGPLAERVPDLQLVLVLGPRIDPAAISAPPGVEVRGFVPRLYEHFAAADAAVVQGGGTTTLELTALRRPFAFFPLRDHFEQSLVVAGRLARHGAGRRLDFETTSPEALAEVVAGLLQGGVSWPPIPVDGARRAAEAIYGLGQVGRGSHRARASARAPAMSGVEA